MKYINNCNNDITNNYAFNKYPRRTIYKQKKICTMNITKNYNFA